LEKKKRGTERFSNTGKADQKIKGELRSKEMRGTTSKVARKGDDFAFSKRRRGGASVRSREGLAGMRPGGSK